MNGKPQNQQWLVAALLGSLLAGSTGLAQIPQDVQVKPSGIQTNGDAGDISIANWGTYWITRSEGASSSSTYDPNMRSDPSIPGSIFFTCDWNGVTNGDINVGATLPDGNSTWLGNPSIKVIDATKYSYLMMDIYWTNVSGMTTWPAIGLMKPDYGMVDLTNDIPIPTTPGWQHLVIPIDPSKPGLELIAGIMIYRWQQAVTTSHAEFWVDNVQLIARPVPVPPPTVGLKKAVPGFTMFATQTPSYNRASLRTGTNANNNVSWVGRSGSVTYLMNVAESAGAAHPYFPLHITIAPGIEPSSDPDWSAANCVFLEIVNQGNGSAIAGLHYKTNQPGNNAMLFGSGNLGAVTNPAILGTWSLTFNQDTNVTVTAPGGATLNAVLPSDVAALFTDPVSVYFGNQMGNDVNMGQFTIFDHIQISGVANPIDEHFTGPLDTNIWSIHAQSGNLQANVLVPADAKYWFTWTTPARGFTVQSTPVLGNSSAWTDATLDPTIQNGSQVWALVRQANLPNANSGFFSLLKRSATRLQVLFPGETNAPGTITGKIGTPDTQSLGVYVYFPVTVNAVDDKWNIKTDVSDTVQLSTSDPNLTPDILPTPAALIGGTFTFQNFYFVNSGTWTVTATDVTTNTLAAGTSTAVTVP